MGPKKMYDPNCSQAGFSAIGLFLLGLAMLAVMSYAGLFNVPKSDVTDTASYHASGSKAVDGGGLKMSTVTFDTPTPTPTTIPPTANPTTVPIVIPTTNPNECPGYTPMNGCTCSSPKHPAVWCNGNLPPAQPDCEGTLSSCEGKISGKTNCIQYCALKPVIYLYPVTPTFVDVKITVPGNFVVSIPEIEDYRHPQHAPGSNLSIGGWKNVLAFPSGILKYNGDYFRELFYESSFENVTAPDNGIFIPSENLKTQLSEIVKKLGLLGNEEEEFLSFWVPKLSSLNKKYIFFSILSQAEKDSIDKVEISPEPDTFIEFMAYFNGVDEKFAVKPFIFPSITKRSGFTAIEWGGIIEK